MDDQVLVAMIAAGGVILGGLITFFSTRRLNQSTALKAITDSTLQLIGPLNQRIDELEVRTDSLKKETVVLQKENDRQKKITERIRCALRAYADRNAYLLHGINTLIAQVMKHEEQPDFVPMDWYPPEVDEDE